MMPPKRFPIRVSSRHPHRLEGADGRPFFLLGDTAWELFHRLTLDEADAYLAVRAEQGFNQVWAALLAEFDGLRVPNRNGDLPFHHLDPRQPNERYFAHADAVMDRAASHGLGIGLLPTWGDKVTPDWGDGPVVFPVERPEIAQSYGELLGRRYADRSGVLWVLGGDRPARRGEDDWTPVWRAMAAGIRAGGATQPMTYHPQGGSESTSVLLHEEPWLDINAIQSGHGGGRDVPVERLVTRDLVLEPPKPTLDAEPNYEDHPVSPWPTWDPANGYFDDHDVRKQAYRSLFAGACGVVYGHHSVWQFASEREPWINHVLMDWRMALRRPGAESMRHLRELLETDDWNDLRPAPELLIEPGEGGERAAAVRGPERILVYRPTRRALPLELEGEHAVASMDPRNGERSDLGPYRGVLPAESPSEDAVFILTPRKTRT
ncbi:hypothetical protein BH11ARM2_BH11ARM2_07700 [soil metagenome]